MLQAYQGYFQKGRFISPDIVDIPENTEVIITVVGNTALSIPSRSQQQLEAMERFVANLRKIDNEPLTDEDFAALENNRVNFIV